MPAKFVIKQMFPKRAFYVGNKSFQKELTPAVQFFDVYEDAERNMKFLPVGIYQIQKVYSVYSPKS